MAMLTTQQQSFMRSFLRDSLISEFQLCETRSETHAETHSCPHCGGTRIVRKGKTGGCQRYLCKDCHRTFAEHITGIFHATNVPLQTWLDYADCMVSGLTPSECAKAVGVCKRTSDSMRRRLKACAFKHLRC